MHKIQDGAVLRSMILEGKRFTAQEALEGKIVDGLGELADAIEFVQKRGLLKIGSSPSFVPLKERLWAGVLDSIDNLKAWDEADEARATRSVAAAKKGKEKVLEWEGKAKL